jgi:hypothetical protein
MALSNQRQQASYLGPERNAGPPRPEPRKLRTAFLGVGEVVFLTFDETVTATDSMLQSLLLTFSEIITASEVFTPVVTAATSIIVKSPKRELTVKSPTRRIL